MRFLALFALVLLFALPARADRFEFPDEGFVIDGPAGWVILTISDLNRTICADAKTRRPSCWFSSSRRAMASRWG